MKQVKLKLTGGKFNNRIIVSYNPETKTTAAIVRTAVFNMLNKNDGVACDLFAGSGAYGFESISRGFKKVYFNDNNKLAIKAIKENAEKLDCLTKIEVSNQDYLKALNYYLTNNIKFDVCFIDPPYEMRDAEINNILALLNSYSNKDFIAVVERKKDSQLFNLQGLSLIKVKNYGTRQIQIYKKE